MPKVKALQPCTKAAFPAARQRLKEEISKLKFTHEYTWAHVHEAACELRQFLEKRNTWARSINTKAKRLDGLRLPLENLKSRLDDLDEYQQTQLNSTVRAAFKNYADAKQNTPDLDDFVNCLGVLLAASKNLSSSLSKRMAGDGDPAKPPSEPAAIKNILRPVCLHLERFEKPGNRLKVMRLIFEAATTAQDNKEGQRGERPEKYSEYFSKWVNTPAGAAAVQRWQGIYKGPHYGGEIVS